MSQTVTFSWHLLLLDQNPMHRRRTCWFSTKKRSTGVANGDFFMKTRSKSARQASQTVTSSWKLDLKALDGRRKRWLFHENCSFWTKIRCTGVANGDLKSDAQASQTVTFRWVCVCFFRVVVLNPMHTRRKRWLFHENDVFYTKIRCTDVAHCDFLLKYAAQASQTVTSSWGF